MEHPVEACTPPSEQATYSFENRKDFVHTWVGEPDAIPEAVPESLVHEIWRVQEFTFENLQTVDGQRLVVLHPGELNSNQGPDFLNARIVIGSTTWVGAVEIHRTSAEWYAHRHHDDTLYQSVILHVALTADRHTGRLVRSDGTVIPEIVLSPRLKEPLRKLKWRFRKGGRLFFACENLWPSVPDATIMRFLLELSEQRIQRKATRIGERFLKTPDLHQICYEEVCRALGYSQNGEAMVLLARRVPLDTLARIPDPRDRAAILLGTAGLICRNRPHHRRNSWLDLEERFISLAQQALPDRLPVTIWRHARLRPANSPEQRILQAAALFGIGGPLSDRPWEKILEPFLGGDTTTELLKTFTIPSDLAGYLSPVPTVNLALGRERRITIIVNAVLPLLSVWMEQTDDRGKMPAVPDLLTSLPVVIDHVVRRYSVKRGRPSSAAIAQGLHELSQAWCGQGRCRNCPIWSHIAKSASTPSEQ